MTPNGSTTLQLVLSEDFSGYELGPFSEEPDPIHETHYVGKTIDQGPWTETSVYHTNRIPHVNIQWVVTKRGGRKVLRQTGMNWEGVFGWRNFVRQHVLRRDICPILFFPSLATGSEGWRNYRIEVSMTPLSNRLCGVLFRAQNSMQHYVFGLARGRASLFARRFNSLELLASKKSHAVSVVGSRFPCRSTRTRSCATSTDGRCVAFEMTPICAEAAGYSRMVLPTFSPLTSTWTDPIGKRRTWSPSSERSGRGICVASIPE